MANGQTFTPLVDLSLAGYDRRSIFISRRPWTCNGCIAVKKRGENSIGKLRNSILCISERNCLDFGLRVVDYDMQIQGTALERSVCSLRVIQSVNML